MPVILQAVSPLHVLLQNGVCITYLFNACLMRCPSHIPSLNGPQIRPLRNNLQNFNLLLIQLLIVYSLLAHVLNI
jgi:hypothetical protein